MLFSRRTLLPLVLLLVSGGMFSGCATPYQPDAWAGGYEETWMSEREAVVSFDGNGYTSADRARSYAAYRACELTLENGFTHFVVLGSGESTTEQTAQVGQDRTTVRPDGMGGLTATTQEAPEVTFVKPSTRMQVYFLTNEEAEKAKQEGYQVVSATYFLEKNAPDDLREEILEDASGSGESAEE